MCRMVSLLTPTLRPISSSDHHTGLTVIIATCYHCRCLCMWLNSTNLPSLCTNPFLDFGTIYTDVHRIRPFRFSCASRQIFQTLTSAQSVQPNTCASDGMASLEPACPLVVKTSKQWVLPPRPKPGRKPIPSKECKEKSKNQDKVKPKKPVKRIVAAPPKKHEHKDKPHDNPELPHQSSQNSPAVISSLTKNIKLVDSENLALKSNLLSLIHDYKHLKDLVLNKEHKELAEKEDLDKNVHKRSFNEVEVKEELDTELVTNSLMNELINDMNDLSYSNRGNQVENDDISSFINIKDDSRKKKNHRKFNHYKDFEKLDIVEDSDVDIDFEDDDEEEEEGRSPTFSASSTGLSRTTSPSSDFENNSLMSTLTRSTTVSSVNTINNHFPMLDKKGYPFKNSTRLFELPKYEEQKDSLYSFQFDEAMNKNQDQYNMINDFLEEKLMTNDLEYYVDNEYEGSKW